LASEAGDAFLRYIGMDADYLAGGHSFFTVESHINFAAQTRAGDHLYVTAQLLSHDEKRFRLFTTTHRADDDSVVSTSEHMLLHVDTRIDKACPADPAIVSRLAEIARVHDRLPHPPQAGRSVGMKK
jgi:carnitine 3-dehydrogenase